MAAVIGELLTHRAEALSYIRTQLLPARWGRGRRIGCSSHLQQHSRRQASLGYLKPSKKEKERCGLLASASRTVGGIGAEETPLQPGGGLGLVCAWVGEGVPSCGSVPRDRQSPQEIEEALGGSEEKLRFSLGDPDPVTSLL